MQSAITYFIVLLLSNVFTLLLIFFNVPIQIFYSMIVIIILILLFILQRFILPQMQGKKKVSNYVDWLFFFLSSFLVISLVFSTGGIYSSFFVLLHFYALMVGFFVSVVASLFFIVISVISLLVQAQIDPRLNVLLIQDPASLALYFFSYFIIVPFSYFLSQQFQIKTRVTKVLQKEAAVNNIILKSINELIIITSLDLKVLSANDAVEQILGLSKQQILNRPLFDILYLRSGDGHFVNSQLLGIEQIVASKSSKLVPNLQLLAKNRVSPLNIKLNIKAVPDLQGSIDQLTFIISDLQTTSSTNQSTESTIKELQTRQQALLESLKGKLISEKMAPLASEVYLMQNLSRDISLAAELKGLATNKPDNSIVDLAQFTNNAVMQHQELAHLLNTILTFKLVNFTYADIAAHLPPGVVVSPIQMTSSYFSTSLPVKWFDVLINKLIFLGILLSLASNERKAEIFIDRYDEKVVRIQLQVKLANLVAGEEKLLFIKGYGALAAKTHLYLGSGIEGYLLAQICQLLGLKLSVNYIQQDKNLTIALYIEKKQLQ